VTDDLVAQVLAAGGRLSLPNETGSGGVNWRQRAYAAQRQGRVPSGKRLSVSRTSTTFEIELIGAPAHEVGELDPIHVPLHVSRYHPVGKEFRSRVSLHEVSRRALPRALRIVHALATEAENRGFQVACVAPRFDAYGRSEWKPSRDGQFVFTLNGHDLSVRAWEKGVELRGIYERQMERWRDDREKPVQEMLFLNRPKPYDSAATGQLNLEIVGWSARRHSWGDRQRWQLEDRLPHLLRELELQAVEAEERRLAKERQEAERQRQWETALEDAKRQLALDHQIGVLRERVSAWREADAIRAYCEAVEARYAGPLANNPEAIAWLKLARLHADELQELPKMPLEPDFTAESLRPYLDGWGPYGPRA
jgi:hypothetical protein